MFYDNQPVEKRDAYKTMLGLVGSLSRLFSTAKEPFLYYRAHENIFAKYFDLINNSRSDDSADAYSSELHLGIGLKTWVGGDNQKVAEFGKLRPMYEGLTGIDLVKEIAGYRNERIRVTKNAHGLSEILYHIVKRVPGAMCIYEQLDILGYHYTYQVLNAMNYGNVAQNRERIYIVAFREKEDYEKFSWPLSVPLTHTVKDLIDFENKVDEKYYYTEGKYKGDIYEKLVDAMEFDSEENPAIYQWRRKYVRKNQSGVVPTLTANQGEGGHNVCIVKTKYGIRKMTPRECFYAQGFPDSFVLPNDQVDSRLYKQAGNSVCVSVINRIAQSIVDALI